MVAPLIAAAGIGAGASLLGGVMQNSAAKSAAAKQMAFQKQTLKHQYQWGMEDMKKAGLNPILAYKQGGAGSASGSSYTPQNVGSAAVQGGSTAAASAIAQLRQETELANIAKDTQLKNEQSVTQQALQQQARGQAALSAASTAGQLTQNRILGQHYHSAASAAARAKFDKEWLNTNAGKVQYGVDKIIQTLSPFK